jgi:hypothetical protein
LGYSPVGRIGQGLAPSSAGQRQRGGAVVSLSAAMNSEALTRSGSPVYATLPIRRNVRAPALGKPVHLWKVLRTVPAGSAGSRGISGRPTHGTVQEGSSRSRMASIARRRRAVRWHSRASRRASPAARRAGAQQHEIINHASRKACDSCRRWPGPRHQ